MRVGVEGAGRRAVRVGVVKTWLLPSVDERPLEVFERRVVL